MRFRLTDIFLPNATDLGAVLPQEEVLEGTVIGFSDSGSTPNAFAVVEIIQTRAVIVPVAKLSLADVDRPDEVQ